MVVLTGAVLLIIAVVAAFLIVGGIGVIVPQMQMYLLALGAGVLAWLTKDAVFYKSRNWQLSGGVLFGAIAAMVLVAMFLGITLPQFTGTIVNLADQPQAITDILPGGNIANFGIMDFATLISVIGATFSIVLGVDVIFYNGKLLTKRRRSHA